MGYYDKHKPEPLYLYCRIKDLKELVINNEYHLRKMLSIEGNSITDEVHDIKLKSVDGNFLLDEYSGKKFEFGQNNFEVFYKKIII